jgi:3-dehydroquinate dehydratase-2
MLMTEPVYILIGPNLNLPGIGAPNFDDRQSLAEIERCCATCADDLGLECTFRQSNQEVQLIDWIHEARERSCGVIINPGGMFMSVAILDALKLLHRPVIEVHTTNIRQCESHYQRSYVSLVATGVIYGLGPIGYELALDAIASLLLRRQDGGATASAH